MNKAIQFNTGRIVATPGAIEALRRNKIEPVVYMAKHLSGNWGVMPEEDKQLNEAALEDGSRLMSAYLLPDETKLWIITEATSDAAGNRSATTLLLPEEY